MKIEDVVIPNCHPQLQDFISDVTNLLNNGKYQFQVLTSPPDYTTTEGSAVLYASGTVRRLYSYVNSQWNYFGFLDSDGKILVDGEITIGSTLRADGTSGLWLGHTDFSSAPFRVSLAGALVATSATISGAITASSGSIGGWTIGSGILSSGSGANAVGMQPGSYPFYAGGSTPSTAPFRVNNLGYVTCEALNVTGAVINASEITSGVVQTSADPAVNRVKMYSGGLMGFDSILGLTFKLPTDGTAPLFANGIIQSATIIDTDIFANSFQTSSVLPWIELTSSGLAYRESVGGSLYGAGALHGDGTKYGVGVQFYIGNSGKPALSIELERTLADIRLFNRTVIPAGAALVGDLACVNGILNLCTGAGTPGTYTAMGGGDVLGPATNTDNNIPQWNGANSKTLKDGLAVGTGANNLVQLNGSAQIPAVSGALLTNIPAKNQLFTSDGTFTAPTGVTQVYITMVGAGGGGAGGNNNGGNPLGGGGGGGGGVCIKQPYTVVAGNGYAVVAGTAGTAGILTGNGGDGEASSFDTTLSVEGGKGGVCPSTGGAGGNTTRWLDATTGSGGEKFIKGGNGGTVTGGSGGGGGASLYGLGGDATNPGIVYGGGGGGGGWTAAGQAGAAGFVLIEW